MSLTNTSSTSILVRASPPKKQRRSPCVVSFSSMAAVHVLESNEEDTFDPSNLWYTPREFKILRKECISTVKRRRAPENYADTADCECECRGLERLMDPRTIKTIVDNSIQAVTIEQTRQRLDGCEDDSDCLLAKVYSAYSRYSTIKARRFGMFDAKEARTAIRSDWTNNQNHQYDASSTLKQEENQLQEQQLEKESSTKSLKTQQQRQESRQPKSTRSHSSGERLPLQEHIKLTLTSMVTRRRTSWI